MLRTLAIENYRSLRDVALPLTSLNVVTGGNGTGKSSLYRALRLVADGARNGMVAALAWGGGLPSVLWAGPEHTGRAVREGSPPGAGDGPADSPGGAATGLLPTTSATRSTSGCRRPIRRRRSAAIR